MPLCSGVHVADAPRASSGGIGVESVPEGGGSGSAAAAAAGICICVGGAGMGGAGSGVSL